jgi:hypothetical protein
MSDQPTGEHRTLVKYLHNRLPCNRKQNRYYGYLSANCDLCQDTEETQNHILQCPNCNDRQTERVQYLVELEQYLEQTRTNTETRVVIIHYVRAWLHQMPIPNIDTLIPEASATLKQAVYEQTRLTSTWGTLYN